MTIQKNKLSLPLIGGNSSKVDDKQQQIGTLKEVGNVTIDKIKKLQKRNGYIKIDTKKLTDSTEIQNKKKLNTFKKELLISDATNLHAYAPSLDRWIDRGAHHSAFPTTKHILRNDKQQSNLDLTLAGTIAIYSYNDSQGTKISIQDTQTDNLIIPELLVKSNATAQKVVAIQNSIYIFYTTFNELSLNITRLKYKKLNIAKPSTLSAETEVAQLHPSTDIDILEHNNKLYLCYLRSDQSTIFRSMSESGILSSEISIITDTNITKFRPILATNGTGYIALTTSKVDAANATITIAAISENLITSVIPNTVIKTVASTTANLPSVSGLIVNTDNSFDLIYNKTQATYTTWNVDTVSTNLLKLDASANVISDTEIVKSLISVSKPIIHDNNTYLTLLFNTEFQSTYFITDINGNVISKINPLVSGDFSINLPKVKILDSQTYLITTQIKGRVVTDDGTYSSLLGISSTKLKFEDATTYQNAELGDNLHIAGGIVKMYDGSKIVEHSYNTFPENLTVVTSNSGSATLQPSSTYQFAAVYTWTDQYGQVHRSAPTIGATVTTAAGEDTADLIVQPLHLTEKENVIIEIYRTEANGEILYRVSSTTAPIVNDKNVDSITITNSQINVTDTALVDNEIIYITGGVLDNIPAPSTKIMTSHNDRLFIAGLEDENKMQYSKIRINDQPVTFNDSLFFDLNTAGGPITALQSLDDKLIIFKEDAIYFIAGDGPNNLGEQDTFNEPELISQEIGCIEKRSIVNTPTGIMFKSRKGIYALTRSLQLTYIGAAVEEFNDLTITSALTIPHNNQIRFTTSNSTCLVYNYFTQQWISYTNHEALSAVKLDNDYHYLRTDGTLYKEDVDSTSDAGSPINMFLETSWLSFAEVQGFQRIYRMLILGKYLTPHKLRIRIAYNFVEAYTQEVIVDPTDFINTQKFGESTSYGTAPVYGGDSNEYQIRVNFKKQKCHSIKIRIEEIQETASGLGLELSNITFVVGAKSGDAKINQAKGYAAK